MAKFQKAKAVVTKVVHVGKAKLAAAQAQLATARKTAAALRRNAGGKGGGLVTTLEVVGGGAAAGAAKVYAPEVMGIDTRLLVGAAGVAAALFAPISPKLAGHAMAFGSGILAGYTQDVVEDMLDGDGADGGKE